MFYPDLTSRTGTSCFSGWHSALVRRTDASRTGDNIYVTDCSIMSCVWGLKLQ